jgi:hypothetical protein
MNTDKKRGSRGVVPRSDSGVSQPHPYVRAGYARAERCSFTSWLTRKPLSIAPSMNPIQPLA